jgi:hypothetical protein
LTTTATTDVSDETSSSFLSFVAFRLRKFPPPSSSSAAASAEEEDHHDLFKTSVDKIINMCIDEDKEKSKINKFNVRRFEFFSSLFLAIIILF